jgi:hypothetical protein
MSIVLIVILVILGIVGLVWVGLRVTPRPFVPLEAAGTTPETVPLREGLPAPVARFYGELYGDEVPVVETAVVSGRGRLRIMGITFPARWRFTHAAGEGYRHDIVTTIFGLPIMRVKEVYADGHARLELPVGVSEGPKVDQGANLALWGEAIWYPSVWVTDPRTAWTPVDDETALLTVPWGDREQTFVARFDPETGLLRFFESMRYKGEESAEKTLWINEAAAWGELDGELAVTQAEVTWFDEGTPWAVFRAEDVVYNVDVQ